MGMKGLPFRGRNNYNCADLKLNMIDKADSAQHSPKNFRNPCAISLLRNDQLVQSSYMSLGPGEHVRRGRIEVYMQLIP